MKKFLSLVGLLVLAFTLVACGESSIEKVDKETPTAGNNDAVVENNGAVDDAEAQPEEEVLEESLTIGDTVNYDGLHITLNDVITSSGSEWEKPSYDHYLILDLTIENTTEEAANISTILQMSLQDEEGYTHSIAFFTETKGSLDGEIGPGRSNRGQVAFDVNQSSVYEFIFENPFTSGQAIWEISVD